MSVFMNLLTNPSFETTSGTVEVRRNLASDPRATLNGGIPSGQARWAPRWFGSGGTGSTTLVVGATDGPEVAPGAQINSYIHKTWTAEGGTGDTGFDHTLGSVSSAPAATKALPITAGVTYTFSSYMRASVRRGSAIFGMRVIFRDAAGERILPAPVYESVAFTANTWTRISNTLTAPANAVYASIASDVGGAGTWAAGDTLDGTALLIEASPVALPYMDGSFSPDSDLTPSWTGAANASASILTGVQVDGAPSSAGRFALSSTKWAASGSRSLRVLAYTGNNDSFVNIAVPTPASMSGKTYTIMGTVRLDAPLLPPLHVFALGFRAAIRGGPSFEFKPITTAPNAAGVHEVRSTFTMPETTSVNWDLFRLMNGTAPGGGDVWWDKVALIEGVYDGPAFDGSSTSDTERIYAWTGTPNRSEERRVGKECPV